MISGLNPGWPELVGKDYKAAISKITEDYLGVTVIYGPKGFMRIQDFRLDRVWLDVNPNGTVAGVPSIGWQPKQALQLKHASWAKMANWWSTSCKSHNYNDVP